MTLEIGVLIIRIFVGLAVAAHGAQKLFGWLGGKGFRNTVETMQFMGFRPAGFWALLGGLGEFGGGLALALGFLSPLGALGITAAMLMAVIKFHGAKGFWAYNGGYEYPLTLVVLGIVLGLVGAGPYSIDALIGFTLPEPLTYTIGFILSLIVVVIGFISSNQKQAQQAAS
jgi:putative oxidoreductase